MDYTKGQESRITIWAEEPLVKEYEMDYKAMTGSFIYGTAPLMFDKLGKRIKELEEKFRNGE